MKTTPLDIINHSLKKSMRGYDRREVDALKELAAGALEEASREAMRLEERLRDTEIRLSEHQENERVLKDAITTAQRMVDGLKVNAQKEAELLIAEARMQADEIVRQAHARVKELQDEIYRLKQQRLEAESAIKAVLDYHSSRLLLEDDGHKKGDSDAEKLRFLPKP